MMATDTDNGVRAFQESLVALERDITLLCESDREQGDFYRVFIEAIISVLGEGGAVWQFKSQDGQFSQMAHMNMSLAGLEENGRQLPVATKALAKVVETSAPVVLPANDQSNIYDGGLGEDAVNDSDHTLLFLPIIATRGEVSSVLMIISHIGVEVKALRGLLGYLMGLCERAGAYLLKRQLTQVERTVTRADRLRQYVSSLHSTLSTKRTCYAMSNYAQEILGVYRCMAGSFSSRGRFRIESVSGLESVAVKSSFIKSISTIAREVCKNGKALIVDNPNAAIDSATDPQADELVTAARYFMLEANTMVMGIFPVYSQDHVVGALVVEKVTEEPFGQVQRKQIDAMLVEASTALNNSLIYRDMPLSWLTRSFGSLRDKLYRMPIMRKAIWMTMLAVLLIMPQIITRQVKVKGTGELIPVNAQIIYAQVDGKIETVNDGKLLISGQRVTDGQVLASMNTDIIDYQIDSLNNQIDQTESQMQTAGVHTAEGESMSFRLESLRAELARQNAMKEMSKFISPMDGILTSQDSQIRHLKSMPVSKGDSILTVMPPEELTVWELEVNIEEKEAGELLEAYKRYKDALEAGEEVEPLAASIIFTGNPKNKYESRVLSISAAAHIMSTGQSKYRNVITVRIAKPDLDQKFELIQGLEAKVAIECRESSLYYSIGHEFMDFIRVSMF